MTHFTRKPSNNTVTAAMDALLRACGHTVTVKPKRKRSTFNTFDGNDRKGDAQRRSVKSALQYITGLRS